MGNVLLVDDERSIRVTLKAFLEEDEHGVDTAEEAEEALSVLQSKPVDVVVTDIILPGISGVDLLRRIRKMSPHVQVIMMTGEPTLETASEALRLGAVDYLQKPVGKYEIVKAVRNALHVKHLSDEKKRLEEENKNYMSHLEKLVEKRTQDLAKSEAALRHRAEELSIINRLARKVNESMTVEESIQCGLLEIVSAVSPDLAVFLLREKEDLLPRGIAPEEAGKIWTPDEAHKVGVCLCGLAVDEDKAIYSADIRSDPRCSLEECRNAGFCSFVALPLRSGEEIIGVLGIASLKPRNFQEHAPFLEALATEMSIGVKKSLLYEQVHQHATKLQSSLTRIREAEAERLVLQEHLQRSQKMEAIGTLASGIAHDFNNILAAVMGYAELAMLEAPQESMARKNIEMVLSAGERAKDLVKQILAFSHQTKEERKPILIEHTVKEVLKFMRASLPTTIEIRQRIDPDLGHVLADSVQIHQVVMNLCTNALFAMKDNGGVLDVQLTSSVVGSDQTVVHPDLKHETYVKLTVKDTGHGMDKATMEKIFDPYFTTKEKGVGTGLGLAVLHGIVQKHGGIIEANSEPGKGSVFHIYFPTVKEGNDLETGIYEEAVGGNERILLVDDEHVLVELGKQVLERLGYSVETRTSSLESLALFQAQPDRYDLVITDMTMPNMTGEKLAEELLRIRPDIPIVLCTGYSEPSLEEKARKIGVKALVMKPILSVEMAKAVRKALGKTEKNSRKEP
jgi:signal transduction histidine kinase/DNA-binding response OmpR family regulator